MIQRGYHSFPRQLVPCAILDRFWKSAGGCGAVAGRFSGYDIGDKIIFDHPDLVLQGKFALFQPGDLQLIGRAGFAQGINRRVEIAVFDLQTCQFLAHFRFVHAGFLSFGRIVQRP